MDNTENNVSKKRCQILINYLNKKLKKLEKEEKYEWCSIIRDEIESLSNYILGYKTFEETEKTLISILTTYGVIQDMDWDTLIITMRIPMLMNEIYEITVPIEDFERIWKEYSKKVND